MSGLAVQLLRLHQQHPADPFFGDPRGAGAAVQRHGLPKLDAAYAELVDAGFVVNASLPVMVSPSAGRDRFRITAVGLDAAPAGKSIL